MNSPRHLFRCFAFLLCLAAQSGWAQAPPDIDSVLKKMLTAAENGSLIAFVADGDTSFRADITPAMFNSFSTQFASRFKQGYTTIFVTKLRQEGYAVYVWKLEFKDGGDDLLFTLAFKDGKVGGFFVR
jgi:hypothetical protein